MAENISPKGYVGQKVSSRNRLERPFPCAPRAQSGNSITKTMANKMSRNLIDSCKPFFSVLN